MDVRGCTPPTASTGIPTTSSSSPLPLHPQYWHIGYPTVVQLDDGTIVTAYHEYTDDDEPIQYMQTARFRLD